MGRRRRSWVERHLPTVVKAARWVGEKWDAMQGGAVRAGAYMGAVVSRLTADWILAPLTSADQEIRSDLKTLRARSRELCRNSPHPARFLDLLAENVVGPHGIRLQARVTKDDGKTQWASVNRRIEAAWKEWGRPENCTVRGNLSWEDVQDLAIQTTAQDGEFLARMVEGHDNPFGFALQILDADQLAHDLNESARDDRNEIRMGVEVDRYGRPLAYWIYPSHPHDYQVSRGNQKPVRVPAREILHHFTQRRPGQTRGVPWMAPVLYDAHQFRGLQEAELISSRVSATKGMIIERKLDEALEPDPLKPLSDSPKDDAEIPEINEPGINTILPYGYTAKAYDPQHPNSAFGDFSKTILRSISAGLKSSYHSLSGDLTEVSYSSIRQGELNERDVYRRLQRWLRDQLHERVYPRWMTWALTMDALRLPSRDPAAWLAHDWMPRGWDWVDPLKDILAAEKELELRLTSRTRIAAARGYDWEEVLDELAHEEKMIRDRELEGSTSTFTRDALLAMTAGTDEDGDPLPAAVLERMQGFASTNGGPNGSHA